MNVDQLRDLLPVTRDFIYMNTGWAGPTPTSVIQSMTRVLEREALEGPASANGLAFTHGIQDETRSALSQMLKASEEDVILTHSTREGVNVVIYGIDWQPGDELLTCNLEHSALTLPASVLAQRFGARVRSVNIPPQSRQSEALELLTSGLNDKTKLVAISHIQYTCGLRMPIKEITEAAHKLGIPVLIDGAQSFGQVDVNLDDLGCDFYALPGQKWLLGPGGTGALYVNNRRRHILEPMFTTNAIEAIRESERLPMARFSLVSQNPALLTGFLESMRLATSIGITEIEQRSMHLADLLRERVLPIESCTLLSPTSQESACGLVTIGLEAWPPTELVDALQERFKIVARAVDDPPGVRFSTHFFNTEHEVEQVAEALVRLVAEGHPSQ